MWALTTSNGLRVDGIRREEDGCLAVRMLGHSEYVGPYSWQVVDNHGQRFVAELRRDGPVDPGKASVRLRRRTGLRYSAPQMISARVAASSASYRAAGPVGSAGRPARPSRSVRSQ